MVCEQERWKAKSGEDHLAKRLDATVTRILASYFAWVLVLVCVFQVHMLATSGISLIPRNKPTRGDGENSSLEVGLVEIPGYACNLALHIRNCVRKYKCRNSST